jgi:hypothetical protein
VLVGKIGLGVGEGIGGDSVISTATTIDVDSVAVIEARSKVGVFVPSGSGINARFTGSQLAAWLINSG